MASRLQEEIKQNKPFLNIQQEAMLNVYRTSEHLQHNMQRILKEHGLTGPQYNVLRILRGAGREGLRCSDIGERMLTHDPDITRLLGRLQHRRLIERRRDGRDRRVIYSLINAQGLQILAELDPVVEENAKSLLNHMSGEKIGMLIHLLEEVRHASAA